MHSTTTPPWWARPGCVDRSPHTESLDSPPHNSLAVPWPGESEDTTPCSPLGAVLGPAGPITAA